MKIHTVMSATALSFGLGLLMSSPVMAVTQTRSFVQNGTGTCQAALPSFEGLIRKRPLAIQNEGLDPAFVNCSLVGTTLGAPGGRVINTVLIGLINNTPSAISVTCTLVDGIANLSTPTFIAKTVSVASGGSNELFWTTADNSGANYVFGANVQCVLPPGTGVSYTSSRYPEDVGN